MMNIQKLKMYFTMVTNALLRRKLRMFIALLAVAIGATIISGMITVYKEVPEQMGREFRAYGANLLLLPASGTTTMQEAKLPAVYQKLQGHEIVGSAPFLYERLKINESPVLVGGTDFDMVKKVSPYWQINGAMPSADKEILLGHELAEKFQAKPGEKIILALGDGSWESPFTVSGIVRTGGKEEQFAYMDLQSLQEIVNKPGIISMAQVSVVANAAELDAFTRQMAEEEPSIHPQTVKQIASSEQTVLGKLQALVLLVTVVVLLLTLVCVGTTMTEVVSERRREIGLKKALGADNRNIAAEFFGESCMLGLLGGILGTVCGYLFAQAVGTNVFGRSLHLSIPIAVMSVVLSIVVTAIATMLPVRTAVKVEPAIVMRGE
ncbi:MAG: ABC transporter permease [Acidaminococcaceae bacterium]|nr:ABC transporter permease [Acidaminococcaceae bacterium]MBR2183590.1 ABC transporter permease [Acidaminococcaceae bacterium]